MYAICIMHSRILNINIKYIKAKSFGHKITGSIFIIGNTDFDGSLKCCSDASH